MGGGVFPYFPFLSFPFSLSGYMTDSGGLGLHFEPSSMTGGSIGFGFCCKLGMVFVDIFCFMSKVC